MREIKFRAWDKRERKMYYDVQDEYDSTFPSFATLLNNDFFEVMQSTCLKDKNGKEIYEGDIVEIECGCGYKDKMPIEWNCNSYKLKQTWSHDFPDGELELCQLKRTEVIGNIYENPELLEEKVE